MIKDEALKMAIGFAETSSSISGELYYQYRDIVINACKEALEQLAQEPVAWMHRHDGEITEFNDFQSCDKCEPLYTHPHQWQGLSNDEIQKIADETDKVFATSIFWVNAFARAIEQALKEKNHD